MPPAVQTRDLRKSYGDVEALRGIDLEIAQGEFFGLLGPNGAGKTTFINCLLGLVKQSGGSAEVFGYDTVDEYRAVHDRVGVAPQEVNLDVFFPIRQVLMHKAGYHGIPEQEAGKRADALLKQMGIYEKRDTKVQYLSGGMKRRALLARALITDPDLLILDEPTAGVDVELRKELWETMRSYNRQGRTILLTTHYIEEAERLCERVAMLKRGEVVAVDSPERFMEQGTDVIEVELHGSAEFELYLPDAEYGVDDDILSIRTENCTRLVPQVLQQLEEQGVTVAAVQTRKASLEDMFVAITGDDDE